MWGTVRSLDPEISASLPGWITNIVTGICETYGAKCQVNYQPLVPSVQNDFELTKLLESACDEAWGSELVQILDEPSLGAEDFAVYLDEAPGCMFRLGVGKAAEKNYPLHHPRFEVDEASIMTGVVTLAYTVWKFYEQPRVMRSGIL